MRGTEQQTWLHALYLYGLPLIINPLVAESHNQIKTWHGNLKITLPQNILDNYKSGVYTEAQSRLLDYPLEFHIIVSISIGQD